jgi:two-component system NtrC family sensor kinase
MWEQMAIVLVLLVTIPLLVLGTFLIGASQEAVKTSVLRDHEQLAVRAASEVGEFFKRPRHLLNTTAAILGTTGANLWKQETVLVELALGEEIFGRISLWGLDGREIATSEIGTPLQERSDRPDFKKALAGNYFMSEVSISKNHTPYVTMSLPVRQMGKIAGVLSAEVSLRGLWDIVDNIKIGSTGRAYVVSDQGVLVAGEDKKKVLSNENLSEVAAVKAVLSREKGSLEYQDASGQKWLEGYAPIPELGWGLVVRQSTDEAYSFSTRMKVESWALIFLSVLLALAVSIVIARLLVKPMKLLVQSTGRVALGDFSQPVPVRREDEIGELIRAFNQMTQKLEKARQAEKLTAIGKAATAIAHELKNSLVMTSTFIGLLPKRRHDEQFLDKFSIVLSQELDVWRNMLQDISDFSRQSGFEMGQVDVGRWLSDFTFLIQERLLQSHVRLDLEASDNLPVIDANAVKLKQALMNLTVNAVEAMPRGGVLKLAVSVTPQDKSLFLEIKVQDTGKGMSEEELGKIFDPFYTNKRNGLGLGLAITHEIIRRHGGSIRARSRLGEGTEFTVLLPVR